MAGAHLYGWYGTLPNPKWVKLVCDADGKLILDPDSKYTDEKARAACKLSGSLYWSCPGVHFDALNPASDDIYKSRGGYIRVDADGIFFVGSISLPHGATITGAIVFGNEAAGAVKWYIRRLTLSSRALSDMAEKNINTEDTTITTPTIDNSLYVYVLYTDSLDTNDELWGARITYTL